MEPWDVGHTQEATTNFDGRPPQQRVIAAGGILVVVLLIAGILAAVLHTSQSSTLNASDIAAAASNTTKAHTAKFTADVVLSSGSHSQTIVYNGAEDFAAKSSTLSVGPIVARVVNGVGYLRPPPGLLPAGKTWVLLRSTAVGANSNNGIVGSGDPASGLQMLDVVTGSPRVVGHDTMDGAKVTHYSVTLDLRALFDRVGQSAAQVLPLLASGVQALEGENNLSALPGDVWIDGHNRVRRFEYQLLVRGAPVAVTERSDVRFSDFGAPVVVAAPPAAQVVPLSQVPDLLRRLLGAAGG